MPWSGLASPTLQPPACAGEPLRCGWSGDGLPPPVRAGPPRAPVPVRCNSGGAGWFNTENISAVGRNRIAALATRSTPLRRRISMLTLAVIPGLSFNARLGTVMTVE